MPGTTDSFLSEANRVLREMAGQQGAAWTAYGEALQRFGESRSELPEFWKSVADLYIREAGRSGWSLLHAGASMYGWLLSLAGAKPLHESETPAREAPGPGQTRGHASRGKR